MKFNDITVSFRRNYGEDVREIRRVGGGDSTPQPITLAINFTKVSY